MVRVTLRGTRCKGCIYRTLLPTLIDRDLPAAPVGERYAALCDVAPVWVVARYVGAANTRMVSRQARLYTSGDLRRREARIARPNPEYIKRCGYCQEAGHLAPTCPLLAPHRNED
jgi:hypothetical protein